MSAPDTMKARLQPIHDALARHVERRTPPGLVTLVARGDEVHVEAIGKLRIDGDTPMRRDTLFRIASMSKPIAAAAAMVLVEEGKLALDAPVDALLPELADRRVLRRLDGPLDDTVPAKRAITLRDLLTFRLGFGLIWGPQDATPIQREAIRLDLQAFGPPSPKRQPAPDAWMRRFATLPLMHQPGEAWRYNTGSEILGVLLARAANQPLEALLRERIFTPLGMKDTSFSVPPEQIGRLATSYLVNAKGSLDLYDEAEGGQWASPPAFPSADGGLVSTVDDMHAFGRMLLRGGKHGATRILSEASVRAMITDAITPEQKAASSDSLDPTFWTHYGWGLGISVVTNDPYTEVAGRFGWDGGLGTSWYSDPHADLVAILMTQVAIYPAASEVYRDFWTSAYRALRA